MELSPPEIWSEAGFGEECWITVCDELLEKDGVSVDAAGVMMNLESHLTIILEGHAETMPELLSHEFIHLIDNALDYKTMEEWDAMSPEDGYFFSYENYQSRSGWEKYTCYSKSRKSKIFFIDSYARTFPSEDRARTGEKLYASYVNNDLTWEFKDYPNVRKKAEKLCEIYRNTFKCLKSVPKGEWYMEKYI